jgi:hypothetical protein
LDNPFVTPVSGQADWDTSLNADLGVIERGYHVTERAGTAINTGQVLWLNSGGFFFPFDPNSSASFPHAMAYTAASSGDSLTALAWGIVRSLGINSPSYPGAPLYVSALTPGVIVTVAAGPKIGRGLAGYGVLFNPDKGTYGIAGSSIDLTNLGDKRIIGWSDTSSTFVVASKMILSELSPSKTNSIVAALGVSAAQMLNISFLNNAFSEAVGINGIPAWSNIRINATSGDVNSIGFINSGDLLGNNVFGGGDGSTGGTIRSGVTWAVRATDTWASSYFPAQAEIRMPGSGTTASRAAFTFGSDGFTRGGAFTDVITLTAGAAVNTGHVVWIDPSNGKASPFNPNSESIRPAAISITRAAGANSLFQAVSRGFVTSLAITSACPVGHMAYVSALTPGVVVGSYAAAYRAVGVVTNSLQLNFTPFAMPPLPEKLTNSFAIAAVTGSLHTFSCSVGRWGWNRQTVMIGNSANLVELKWYSDAARTNLLYSTISGGVSVVGSFQDRAGWPYENTDASTLGDLVYGTLKVMSAAAVGSDTISVQQTWDRSR